MVYFTTWSYKKPFKFIAARCGVKKLNSHHLNLKLKEVIATLWLFGFVVTTIGSDGAAENRSLFKGLATRSINDLVDQQKLPPRFLDYKINSCKIAFSYPHNKESDEDILIFIQSDMPHIVKKFMNALE